LKVIAFILAAGRGKRLGSLTLDKPKVLLELDKNFTFLDYHVAILTRYGRISPTNIYVVAGYKAKKVIVKANTLGLKVIVNRSYNKHENMYSVYVTKKVTDKDSDTFIILNGDTIVHPKILEIMLSGFMRVRNNTNNIALFAIDTNKILGEEEMKVLVRRGRIVRFGKDLSPQQAFGEYIGLSIYDNISYRKFLNSIEDYVKRGVTYVWYEIVLNSLVSTIDMIPVDVDSLPWIEVDTPEDYARAKALYRDILKDLLRP